MPDFVESLQGKDLGHIHIISQLWGEERIDQDVNAALLQLKEIVITTQNVEKMLSELGAEAREALDHLRQNSGRMPWAQFTRSFGEVREMGPARRDRERPYEMPVSPAETLWYRGLVARSFFDSPAGPQEYAYIPDDLLAILPQTTQANAPLMCRTASAVEYARIYQAEDRILDHACTYLAATRVGVSLPDAFFTQVGEALTPAILNALLSAAALFDEHGTLLSEPVRLFLEAGRGDALSALFLAWRQRTQFNELRMLPGLVLEGNWVNDPVQARSAVLGWINGLKAGTWWNLDSFIAAVKQRQPDFQRTAGDYDAWFIKDTQHGVYLRGFEHWEDVDGRLIRFLVTGPLYWLGILDLACPETGQDVTAFRCSSKSEALLKGEIPTGFPLEKESLASRSDGRIRARRLVPRSVRYQLARFCEWEKESPDDYRYQITPVSLERARQQGLKVSQLVGMLTRFASAVPPSLLKALKRWDERGCEARLEKLVVLRVSSEDILQALRKSAASRFLGEPLGPTTIAIKPGAMDKVLAALAELGYLGEIRGTKE